MKRIDLKGKKINLQELKFQKKWKYDGIASFINISGLTKKQSDQIRNDLRGNKPLKSFGKFELEGSVDFKVNDFYVTLMNVKLTAFRYEKGFNQAPSALRISFQPMDGFGYVSGYGQSVLREAALKDLLGDKK